MEMPRDRVWRIHDNGFGELTKSQIWARRRVAGAFYGQLNGKPGDLSRYYTILSTLEKADA
jgi:hypothetical protein